MCHSSHSSETFPNSDHNPIVTLKAKKAIAKKLLRGLDRYYRLKVADCLRLLWKKNIQTIWVVDLWYLNQPLIWFNLTFSVWNYFLWQPPSPWCLWQGKFVFWCKGLYHVDRNEVIISGFLSQRCFSYFWSFGFTR